MTPLAAPTTDRTPASPPFWRSLLKRQDINGVTALLDRLDQIDGDDPRVPVELLLDAIGRRSFGTLLLLAGLLTLAPLVGDIPGVPSTIGVCVFLLTVQLLVGRERFWLPQWLLKRTIQRTHLRTAINWLRRPARWIDRLLGERLTVLVQGVGLTLVAVHCLIVASVMPLLDFIPFSANAAGLALTAFGLSLVAKDGLLALIAHCSTVTAMALVARYVWTSGWF